MRLNDHIVTDTKSRSASHLVCIFFYLIKNSEKKKNTVLEFRNNNYVELLGKNSEFTF